MRKIWKVSDMGGNRRWWSRSGTDSNITQFGQYSMYTKFGALVHSVTTWRNSNEIHSRLQQFTAFIQLPLWLTVKAVIIRVSEGRWRQTVAIYYIYILLQKSGSKLIIERVRWQIELSKYTGNEV